MVVVERGVTLFDTAQVDHHRPGAGRRGARAGARPGRRSTKFGFDERRRPASGWTARRRRSAVVSRGRCTPAHRSHRWPRTPRRSRGADRRGRRRGRRNSSLRARSGTSVCPRRRSMDSAGSRGAACCCFQSEYSSAARARGGSSSCARGTAFFNRVRPVQPARQGLPDGRDRRAPVPSSDFRNTVPRFSDPDAHNCVFVDLLERIAIRVATLVRRPHSPPAQAAQLGFDPGHDEAAPLRGARCRRRPRVDRDDLREIEEAQLEAEGGVSQANQRMIDR